ncbi:conserved hypothetical protein [Histoplasma capsulatum var. duboisii H88]|uniref:Fungal-type protein kinase domain-containing protein n=1 Tax=Ajellomyces capsulatus (strain H88) TaxID=544711 RepID=F0UM58_AJEC8|nr:conserved hypothetical protein [Histoplasma capsulatum var. duboisii H88]
MSWKQLGFDSIIVVTETEQYIEIDRNGTKEQLIIDKITPLIVKDSWQYLKCTEKGELLQEVMAKGVKYVTRYYHYETVCIDNKDDDVLTIRKSLSISISKDKKNSFKMRV